ncbi:DMT family transporter [Oceaniglobus roseus]|uniref:DMT family transporter n=1 Tax=Oceaniglobus roseus TaxID=1737570 RepID=UPI000C7F110B|nr:DMT family transporter [Kandeliimicrobium roseum]
MSDNMRGALLMMTCMVAFTINDTFMKIILGEIGLFQALFLRGIVTTAALVALAAAMGVLVLPPRPRDRWLILVRTFAEVSAAWLFMTALVHMPIANVSAILQVLPLSVTLVSALVFRDPLGWRRLSAIAIGFFGVLLIVRPGTEGFTVYSVYALASVACVTLRDIAARGLSREVPSITVAMLTALGVTLSVGAFSAFETWEAVDGATALHLAGASLFVVAGYLSSVMTMRVGEIGVIAPFRYTSLVAALILGLVVFGDWPAPLTLLGAAIVVGMGIFTLLREHHLGRVRRRAVTPRPL